MQLTSKQLGITATAGITGLCAGALLLSGGVRLQLLSLAGLLALPPVAVGLIVIDTKAQNRINQAEEKVDKALRDLDIAAVKITSSEAREAQLKLDLTEVQNSLNRAKELLKVCESERCQSASIINQQYQKIDELETLLKTHQARLEDLEAEVEEWEATFHTRLESEAEARFQAAKRAEIKKIEAENDALTKEAIEIAKKYRQWATLADTRLQDRREFVENITHTYNEKVGEFSKAYSEQVAAYLEQIELLNVKIGMLQQKLEGDLIQPEYGQFGYAIEGQIANHIAEWVWRVLKMPLAVKGYQIKSDGSVEVGYGFSRSVPVEALVADLNRHSSEIAKHLGIHKITSVRKLEISDLIILTFRREAALKESGAKLLAGSPEEFIKYVVTHPIRYRLIADPGQGKTPTTAVMLSAILKEGCRTGNTTKGKKVLNTLVTVSYPGAQSSLKDSEYPLEQFLKYGTTTAAIKSFDDAVSDWEYRQQNLKYAKEFFQIWVWDELDNTINSATDPNKCSENLKLILKQGGHSNIGWIVSGQSVMTSQIKGFKDDDRSLFTEIIIGIPKIRMYIKKYAKGKESDANLAKLERNLDDLESYIESVNDRITDTARLLRLALIIDDKSPKLYFLPNLDSVDFDEVFINESVNKASGMVLRLTSQTEPSETGSKRQNPYTVSIGATEPNEPKTTMQGVAHCPHCGNSEMSFLKEQRYRCKPCNRKIAPSKVVFK
jgi:hypothetical protein